MQAPPVVGMEQKATKMISWYTRLTDAEQNSSARPKYYRS
jgi:hypothetical protein